MRREAAKTIMSMLRRPRAPRRLERRQIRVGESELERISDSVRNHYHRGWRSEQHYDPGELGRTYGPT